MKITLGELATLNLVTGSYRSYLIRLIKEFKAVQDVTYEEDKISKFINDEEGLLAQSIKEFSSLFQKLNVVAAFAIKSYVQGEITSEQVAEMGYELALLMNVELDELNRVLNIIYYALDSSERSNYSFLRTDGSPFLSTPSYNHKFLVLNPLYSVVNHLADFTWGMLPVLTRMERIEEQIFDEEWDKENE